MSITLPVNESYNQELDDIVASIKNEIDMVRILGHYTTDISMITRSPFHNETFAYLQQCEALSVYVKLNLLKHKLETKITSYANSPPNYLKQEFITPIFTRIDELTSQIRKYVPEPFKTNEK